jgi:hypothetical protein
MVCMAAVVCLSFLACLLVQIKSGLLIEIEPSEGSGCCRQALPLLPLALASAGRGSETQWTTVALRGSISLPICGRSYNEYR